MRVGLKVKFCPKCGSTLLPQKKEKKIFLACGKCGYVSTSSDKQIDRLTQDREKIIVISRDADKLRTLPKVKQECPKCNNHEAFYWLVQTRGGDESSTQFFRCTNCGATWRENS
jgi:DNA-directed RNA polymerase subunit M